MENKQQHIEILASLIKKFNNTKVEKGIMKTLQKTTEEIIEYISTPRDIIELEAAITAMVTEYANDIGKWNYEQASAIHSATIEQMKGQIEQLSIFRKEYDNLSGNYQLVIKQLKSMRGEVEGLKQKPEEFIICAANYYNDGNEHTDQPVNITIGFVVCGRRHFNCISTFAKIVGFPYTIDAQKVRQTEEQGFLTNTNRFVRRKEALQIASKANQLIHDVKLDSNIGLTSEDIY